MMAGTLCDPQAELPVMGKQRRIRRGPCVVAGADAGLSAAGVIDASIRCTAASRNQPPAQTGGCQPLGAWHCAQGFADCRPVLLDGDACLNHFNRFLERQGYLVENYRLDKDAVTAPSAASAPFSTSAALEAVFSTCLSRTPPTQATPGVRHRARAQTPSFVGGHGHGWDALFEAMIKALRPADLPLASPLARRLASRLASRDSINLVLGFEQLPRNYDVMEQLFAAFGLHCRLLSDGRAALEADEAPHTHPGGTTLEDLRAAPGARHTLLARPWQLPRTQALISERWGHEPTGLPIPMGLTATDAWLELLANLAGTDTLPPTLTQARQQLANRFSDARARVALPRIALYGEPDFVLGATRLLRDLGNGPALLVCPNGDRHWQQVVSALLDENRPPPLIASQTERALSEALAQSGANLLLAPPGFAALRDPGTQGPLERLPLVDLEARPGEMQPATLGYAGAAFMLQRLLEAIERLGREKPRSLGSL